jgi:hypothetical protein
VNVDYGRFGWNIQGFGVLRTNPRRKIIKVRKNAKNTNFKKCSKIVPKTFLDVFTALNSFLDVQSLIQVQKLIIWFFASGWNSKENDICMETFWIFFYCNSEYEIKIASKPKVKPWVLLSLTALLFCNLGSGKSSVYSQYLNLESLRLRKVFFKYSKWFAAAILDFKKKSTKNVSYLDQTNAKGRLKTPWVVLKNRILICHLGSIHHFWLIWQNITLRQVTGQN